MLGIRGTCLEPLSRIHALESVQRRASRLALNQRKGEMSYEDRCQLLKWPTLFDRRIYLSLVECYKTVFGFYQLSVRELIIPTNFISNLPNSIVTNILFLLE